MQIKKYNPTHYTACIEIINSNTPQYFTREELEGFKVWLHGQATNTLAYKNTEAEYFYILESDGRIVGCGGYYIIRDTQVANMTWGAIHHHFHRQGFGKLLFEYRVNQVAAHYPGYNITLDTTQHTSPFYEKMGFTTTQIIKDYYGEGLDRYDMVLNTPLQ